MTHHEHTVEDDIEVFSTKPGLDWISAPNFVTHLQKLSAYASCHLEVSELAACLEKASFSCTSGHVEGIMWEGMISSTSSHLGRIPMRLTDDDEDEEHLAPADSTAIASPDVDPVPSAEETESFETNESAATPPPPPAYRTTSRIPTYADAPLGYRAAEIQLRATSPLPLPAPSSLLPLPTTRHKEDVPESDVPPRKRVCLTAPTPRFEVKESFADVARQPGSIVAHRIDYSFVDTMDASIQASERRTMAAIEMVNLRRDRAALCDEVDTLRRYLSSLYTTHEQERVEACQALDRSEAHNRALEARIAVLETQAYSHECQRQDADDHATRAIMRIQALKAGARVDTLEDTGSSA
ncbi:hypothetical protein Tco_0623001 [Tanacetum coccineum]